LPISRAKKQRDPGMEAKAIFFTGILLEKLRIENDFKALTYPRDSNSFI
jgi:hypothetical protein